MPWPPSSVPTIVAEALVPVGHPLRTGLRVGAAAPATAIVRAIAAGVAPAWAADPPPAWLFPEQRGAFARALAALRRFRGVMLAEPTGSGKTYIALAVARAYQCAPIACIVPAALVPQWRAAIARLGIAAEIGSHESASRGRLPAGTTGLVVIDESHHFRHAGIQRYAHAADFLLTRPALLVTATPVVNRIDDLAHQLRLAVRDDALAADGMPSLLDGSAGEQRALGAIVIHSARLPAGMPRRSNHHITIAPDAGARTILRSLDALALCRHTAIATLIRGVLVRALASSPAALLGALRRYRTLLNHTDDARMGGRTITRADIRQWAGTAGDQMVLWPMLPEGAGESDLVAADAEPLDRLIAAARALLAREDGKLARLRALLADGRRTLVFTTARDTVSYIRRRLGGPIAWCTGDRAGVGFTAVPRHAVLAQFAAGAAGEPSVLVATDVAAEGLDLQGAERVVHYDLPWTAMRMGQREGRAARLGSRHGDVEVVRFNPGSAIDSRLRLLDALVRSAEAPAWVGLGESDLWRWRAEAADRFSGSPATSGVAAVASPHRGVLAGAVVRPSDPNSTERWPGELFWLAADGSIMQDPRWLLARLDEAASAREIPVEPAGSSAALSGLTPAIASMLRRASRIRWDFRPPSSAVACVRARLFGLARAAGRRRDRAALAAVERALAIAAGGLTAGEERLLLRLSGEPDAALLAALARLPGPAAEPRDLEAAITGMVLFGGP